MLVGDVVTSARECVDGLILDTSLMLWARIQPERISKNAANMMVKTIVLILMPKILPAFIST